MRESSGASSRGPLSVLMPKLIGLVGALACLGALASCAEEPTEPDAAANDPTPAAKEQPTTEPTPTPTTPTPTLEPLDQPAEWEDPELLPDPGEDAPTLERLEYELVKQVWIAAGVRAATEMSCDMTEHDLGIPGDYDYECIVTYDGVEVPYSVTTTTTDTTSTSVPSTDFTVLTKEKALHELTRQAIDPAEVSCDMDDSQLVMLDDPTGLSCEVIDVTGERQHYSGEVSANGGVFFTKD